MMYNQKVKNATPSTYNSIQFRSLLEVACYKKLQESGLNFTYESQKLVIWEGFKLSKVKYFCPKGNNLSENTTKLISITFLPDFIVRYKNYIIIFDVKGKANDVYPLKKKLLLKKLEELSNDDSDNSIYIFMEPHSVKQMVQAISYIKTL